MKTLFLTALLAAQAAGGIDVVVESAATGEPLPGAQAVLETTGDTLRSGDDGRILFADVAEGQHWLTVSADGFRPQRQRLQVGRQVLRVRLGLTPLATTPARSRARVVGRVTDDEGASLSGVSVEVLGTGWGVFTDAEGRFEIALPMGSWELQFTRMGRRPATRTVTLSPGEEPLPLFVALPADAVQLRALTVAAPRAPSMAQTVSKETVRQAPALGEPDVFRAAVLLPGVTQPNDLKGRIHLAGGASDETGFTLDGHTLQDPFHLLGLMGSFNVAALEHASVLLHHVPQSVGGRVSGWVDLATKSPEADASTEAVVSLLSSGLTMWRPDMPAGLDLLASGRVTYLDRIVAIAQSSGNLEDVPRFGFHDAVVRLGADRGPWRAEALAFHTRDRFLDPELERRNDGTSYTPLHWGETLFGFNIDRRSTDWQFAGRLSWDRAITRLDERPIRPTFVDSERDWASAKMELRRFAQHWSAGVGAAVDHRRNRQTWEARGLIDELLSPRTPSFFQGDKTQMTTAVFGDVALESGSGWSLGAGGRLWQLTGTWYPSVGIRAARTVHERLTLHASAERRFQFDAQSEEPLEGSISPPLFLLDVPRSVDAAALAADWEPPDVPFGGRGEIRIEAFARHYPDRPVLRDRGAGETREDLSASFPNFRRVESRAAGVSLAGRFTWADDRALQGSYSYQRVREQFEPDQWSPTAWDSPHNLTLYVSGPGPWGFATTAALQLRSGAAVTPVEGYTFAPTYDDYTLMPRYLFGARNSLRLPAYRRLDLGMRKTWSAAGADWTFFFQILNLLAQENPIGYDWRQYFSKLGDMEDPPAGRGGLPVLPSFGIEVAW